MNLQDFINKWNGQKCDWDHAYGTQCVDLYRQYVQEVLNFPQSPLVMGAADIFDKYLTDKYDRVMNTPLGVPQPGDIVIWGRGLNATGHCGIFVSGNMWSFTSFDQNWPVGSPCHLQKHNYRYVRGWLHPKQPVLAQSLPKLPLKLACIGSQNALGSDFASEVEKYSSGKISFVVEHYNAPVPSGTMTQEISYGIVDKVQPTEPFIFIFYQGSSDSVLYATGSYPARNCYITTAPGNDPRALAFELSHQLGKMVNDRNIAKFDVLDSMFPSDDFIKAKYDLVIPYFS